MGESFDEFLRRYPADVAAIDILHVATWRYFLKSPEWRLVFYGPRSAVFLKKTVPFSRPLTSAASDVKNAGTAFRLFHFEAEIGDLPAAWATLDHIERALSQQASFSELAAARAYREALRAGDWARARARFDEAFRERDPGERDSTIRKYLANLTAPQAPGSEASSAAYRSALEQLGR